MANRCTAQAAEAVTAIQNGGFVNVPTRVSRREAGIGLMKPAAAGARAVAAGGTAPI
jgi:hypothetical protein